MSLLPGNLKAAALVIAVAHDRMRWSDVDVLEADGWVITAGLQMADGHRLVLRRGAQELIANVEGER